MIPIWFDYVNYELRRGFKKIISVACTRLINA